MITPILAWLDPFDAPAASWTVQDWLAPLGYQMVAQGDGGAFLARPMGPIGQAVHRASAF